MNGDIEELKQKVAKLEERLTKPLFKIPEASLLIFIVTASCYLLIFWYESGWCSYFNINPAFIHPDLFTMLGSGIGGILDRKSTRLNSSDLVISYAVFCL